MSCCPPNIVKTWGFLGSTQFSTLESKSTVAVHLYFGANCSTTIDGSTVSIELTSGFPYAGDVNMRTTSEKPFELALRIPGWARGKYTSSMEGREEAGYLYIQVPAGSSELKLDFNIESQFIFAHPRTRKDEVAIVRGPLVYCAESVDNELDLEATYISPSAQITESVRPELASYSDVPVLEVPCKVKKDWSRGDAQAGGEGLYSSQPPTYEEGPKVTLVPYFLRNNRGGDGAMRVWLGWSS